MLIRKKSHKVDLILRNMGIGLMSAVLALGTGQMLAQNSPDQTSEIHQMILTKDGMVAIDVPKGWVQAEGPGLAYFLPKGVDVDDADVWIYMSSAPVGSKEDDKDVESYIQSDISAYKQKFKNAVVHREVDLALPEVKRAVSVYTFQSGEERNAFEEVVYIPEAGRVLILTLSAKNANALNGSMNVFHEFAKSYRGSIQTGSPEK
jgi:hypothetical protein